MKNNDRRNIGISKQKEEKKGQKTDNQIDTGTK